MCWYCVDIKKDFCFLRYISTYWLLKFFSCKYFHFRNCVNLVSTMHLEDKTEVKLKTEFKFKPRSSGFIKVNIKYAIMRAILKQLIILYLGWQWDNCQRSDPVFYWFIEYSGAEGQLPTVWKVCTSTHLQPTPLVFLKWKLDIQFYPFQV